MGISVGYSLQLVYFFIIYYRNFRRLKPIKIASGLLPKAIFLFFLITSIMPAKGFAADASWTGSDPVNADWSDADNWSIAPVPGTGDTATFDSAAGVGGSTIDLGLAVTVDTIIFDNTGGTISDYTIGAGAVGTDILTLDNDGAITMNANVNQDQLFNADLVLGTDATASGVAFANNSLTNELQFAGDIEGGTGGVAAAQTLTVTGTGDTIVSGSISDGDATNLSLAKAGAGTLTLSGANTYTGATAINGGTLQISAVNNLGDGSATNTISINDATLRSTSGTYSLGTNRTITLAGAGTIQAGAGILTVDGAVNTNANLLTLSAAGGNINVSGAVTGTGGLTTTGTSNVILNNITNAISGNFTLAGNDVTIVNTLATNLAASNIANDFSLTAGGAITQTGDVAVGGDTTISNVGNDITLDRAGNDFTGAVSVTGANVALVDANAIDLGANTVSGTYDVTATNGNITDSGALDITGTSSFTTSTADTTITLDQASSYAGAVSFTTSGTTGNVSLSNSQAALALGASTVGGNLAVDSNDNDLTVSGALSTVAANGDIELEAGTATLTSNAAIDAGTGTVTLVADNITLAANINGTGDVEIWADTASRSIGIGTGAVGDLSIVDSELDYIVKHADRTIVVGDDTAVTGYQGAMTINDYDFGASSLTLNFLSGGTGEAVFNGTTEGTGDLLINGSGNTTTFNADQTWAAMTINDAVELSSAGAGGRITLKTTAGDLVIQTPGTINQSGAIDSSLYLDATGNITVSGAIGATNALSYIDAAGDGLNITATGNISINHIGGAAAGVTDSTVVSAGGTLTIAGDTYNTDSTQSYTGTTGGISLSAGAATTFTTSADDVTFNNTVTLGNGSDLIVTTSGTAPGSGNITMGTIRGNSSEDVTLNAGDATVTVGAIGSGNEINTVAITGADITLDGNITTDNTAGNSVTLTGAVTLGNDVTIDTSAGTGDIDFTSTVDNAGNLLTINNTGASDATITGVISGAGGLTKQGTGALTINTVTYIGDTTVDDGILNLKDGLTTSDLVFSGNGTVNLAAGKDIEGSVTNSSGATTGTLNYLGSSTTYANIGASAANTGLTAVNINAGTLTLGHNIYATTTTVANGATVDIGSNSLTIGGALDMILASKLKLDILDSSTSGSLTVTGAADIPVTALVDLNITSGQYIPDGATYTVVDGTGGTVAGGNTVTDNNPYVSFTATGGADLTLVASRTGTGFDSYATTGNSRAAGVALEDAGSNNPSSDMLSVLGAMAALPTSSIEGALTQMYPQIDRSIIDANNTVSVQSIQTMSDHLHYSRTGGASGVPTGDSFTTKDVWIKGFGTRANQDMRQGIQGYKANVWGTAVGADLVTTQNVTAGIGIGYANTNVKAKKPNIGKNDINTLQGLIYYGYDSALNHIPGDMIYFNLIGSFGWNTYDASRTVSFGSINRTAEASYDGQQYTAYAETGYHVPLGSVVDWIPFFSLRYTRLNTASYTETEADSLNLEVGEQGYNMCELGLGMKFVSKIRTESFDFMPEIRAQWLYDVIADHMETTSRFTGGGAAFKSVGAKPAKSMFDLGGSLTFITNKNITVDFDYDYSFRQDYSENDASAVLKFGVLLP